MLKTSNNNAIVAPLSLINFRDFKVFYKRTGDSNVTPKKFISK